MINIPKDTELNNIYRRLHQSAIVILLYLHEICKSRILYAKDVSLGWYLWYSFKHGNYVILLFMFFCVHFNSVLCYSEKTAVGITAYVQCGILSAQW